MTSLVVCYWFCAACVLYTYIGYPLLVAGVARFRRRRAWTPKPFPTSVSVIVAAHNEEASIGRRLDELTRLLAASGIRGEVIVVSDGSTDATATLARAHAKDGVRVLELSANAGKAAALTAGCALAVNEIIVFADVRQSWAPTALRQLLEGFTDPSVGAVSGDLKVESTSGALAGIGLYWRFEKWLRYHEGRAHSVVGVTGAISAVRRELFRPIPAGTILDDVYWPLQVAMQGFRVIHDPRAWAYDRLPEKVGDEFQRKVRTLSGNFQLLTRLPGLLVPWRNPLWLQFLSHKLLRLLVPWALLAMIALSLVLPGPFYHLAFEVQIICYLLGLLGLLRGAGNRLPLASPAASFLILNGAAWLAFWVWISGNAGRSWRKAWYKVSPVGYSVHS